MPKEKTLASKVNDEIWISGAVVIGTAIATSIISIFKTKSDASKHYDLDDTNKLIKETNHCVKETNRLFAEFLKTQADHNK